MIHTMMSVSGRAPDPGLVCCMIPLSLNFSGVKCLAELKQKGQFWNLRLWRAGPLEGQVSSQGLPRGSGQICHAEEK